MISTKAFVNTSAFFSACVAPSPTFVSKQNYIICGKVVILAENDLIEFQFAFDRYAGFVFRLDVSSFFFSFDAL